ncbi:MAG: AI-2E family transporter [Clostridiales bacterium]|nr:AI-2E family transporter [Clostridiales bacterium]
MKERRDSTYFKWGVTALAVIFISILLVVIFTDLPGFFKLVTNILSILSPLISGAVIAFLLNPLVRLVDRWLAPKLTKHEKKPGSGKKLSRAISIVFALIFAALVIYAFFSILLPQLGESIQGIIDSAPKYFLSIEQWATNLLADNPEVQYYADMAIGKIQEYLNEWVSTSLPTDIQNVLTTVFTSAFSVVKSLANIVIGVFASIYILASKDKFQAQGKKIVVALFKPARADHILHVGREINRVFNGFVIGKIIDSAIIGVLCYLGMLILKLPYPALVATVVGVTNVIPFFGPIIGAVPSALLILLVNPLQAFYFVIFVIVLQQVDGNVIGPRILGNSVGISGFWVLISITVATSLFGFAGMILGVPVFAVIYMLISDAVNSALRRKGRSTVTNDYYAIRAVEDLPEESAESEPQAEAPAAEEEPAADEPAKK